MNSSFSRWLVATAVACLFAWPSHIALSQTATQVDSTAVDAYRSKAADKVKAAWTVPNVGFAACVLNFKITKDGTIDGLTVKDSSGMQTYDKSCLDAIGSTAPFASLPQGMAATNAVARFVVGGGNTIVSIGMDIPGTKAPGKSSAVSLDSYQTDLQHQLTTGWSAPSVIHSACAYYTFKINKGGGMSDVKVIDSSSVNGFDKTCKDAIAKSAPFSPLPKGVSSLTVNAHFDAAGQDYHVTVMASPAVPIKRAARSDSSSAAQN
jgi:TonB family protein